MTRRPLAFGAFAVLVASVLAGCGWVDGWGAGGEAPDDVARAIEDHGCASCHVVPGVRGADGTVGPPLTDFGERAYIAGALVNDRQNLIRWLLDPQGVEPGTAMPDPGLSGEDAEAIADYLLER